MLWKPNPAGLGLSNHVRFENRYVSYRELVLQLLATDVYIVPYLNLTQVVSGTLAYALGCGRAIVSTRSTYAQEVLAAGRGEFVEVRDSGSLSAAIGRILRDPVYKANLQQRAYAFGRQMLWPAVARAYAEAYEDVCDDQQSPPGFAVRKSPSQPEGGDKVKAAISAKDAALDIGHLASRVEIVTPGEDDQVGVVPDGPQLWAHLRLGDAGTPCLPPSPMGTYRSRRAWLPRPTRSDIVGSASIPHGGHCAPPTSKRGWLAKLAPNQATNATLIVVEHYTPDHGRQGIGMEFFPQRYLG